MNIHEYQAKEILAQHGIPVPRGRVAMTADQVERAAKELNGRCVVKAQVYAGGRGKAGGVRIAHHPEEAREIAKELFAKNLVTSQTGPEGLKVRRILVEEPVEIAKEFYLSITLDRERSRFVVIASAEGGMDIEEVAKKTPERILTLAIEPFTGIRPYQARAVAKFIGLTGQLEEDCANLILSLYAIAQKRDAVLVEINPLVITRAGWLLAMDAKIAFDDNAVFRHREYPDLVDYSQLNGLEITAAKFDLAYIKLDGSIGCMVNGAGLAMATLDILCEHGGRPANFLDVGGGATTEKVAEAFRIILEDPAVTGVFVNIFGGIMCCDVIAEGVLAAAKEAGCHLPIVVRMDGAKVEEGRALLAASGLDIHTVTTLADGAALITRLVAAQATP